MQSRLKLYVSFAPMEFVHSRGVLKNWGRGDFLYIPQRYIHYSSCRACSHTRRQAAAMHSAHLNRQKSPEHMTAVSIRSVGKATKMKGTIMQEGNV